MSEDQPQEITYPREVLIGDRTYRISRFKGMKASLAGALLAKVLKQQPQLQMAAAEFRQQFRTTNSVTITRAMAKLPRFATLGLTTEDFGDAQSIELPQEPSGEVVAMHMFSDIFELADKELRRFLAIIVIPNSELEEADDADDIEGHLDRLGKQLFREGDIDELLELFVIGREVFQEQMGRRRESLGKLPLPNWAKALVGLEIPEEETQEEEISEEGLTLEDGIPEAEVEPPDSVSNGHGEMPQTQNEIDPQPPLSSTADSSTDSLFDSDGTEEPSFTTSPGTS